MLPAPAMLVALSFAFADTADTAEPSGEPPVADAGVGLLAQVGDTVVLNGMASADPEGAELSFAWTQVGGPEVELKKAATPRPEFTIAAPGTHRFALVVHDGGQDSEPDVVEIVAPERAFGGQAGGCHTGGAPAGLGLVSGLVGLWARRKARA